MVKRSEGDESQEEGPPTLDAFERQLRAVEQGLRASLEKIRAQLTHSGNKGAGAELAFRNEVARFLPSRLALSHGEVIDSYGSRSAQCDLVIVTDEHPAWFRTAEPSVFLVEGVAGVGEIKSLLTSEHLSTSIENCHAFRQLRPSWKGHAETVASLEDAERYYRNPPYFLFAYESQLAIETIAQRIAASHQPDQGRRGEGIDGVFVLDRGYVQNFGNGESAFVVQDGEGQRLTGYYYDDCELPLLALMRWLPLALTLPQWQLPVLAPYVLADVAKHQRNTETSPLDRRSDSKVEPPTV